MLAKPSNSTAQAQRTGRKFAPTAVFGVTITLRFYLEAADHDDRCGSVNHRRQSISKLSKIARLGLSSRKLTPDRDQPTR